MYSRRVRYLHHRETTPGKDQLGEQKHRIIKIVIQGLLEIWFMVFSYSISFDTPNPGSNYPSPLGREQ